MRELLWTNGRGIIDGETIWFVPSSYSCLCQYNYVNNKIIKFIFLDGATSIKGSHYSLLKYEECIVLIPARDMNIFIYDINQEKLHRIPLKGKKSEKEKFIAGAIWNQCIYMFPSEYPKILKLDMTNMNLEYIEDKRAEEYFEAENDYTDLCVTIGSLANLLLIDSNTICEFDMKTDLGKEFVLGNEDICYKTMCQYRENELILSDQNGDFWILNDKKEIIAQIPSDKNRCFSNCVPIGDGYLFVPYARGEEWVYWDGSSRREISVDIEIESTMWANNWKFSMFSRAFYDENRVLLFNYLNRSLCILDKNTRSIQERHIVLENLEEEIAEKIYSSFAQTGIVSEKGIVALGLEGLLKHVEKREESKKGIVSVGDKLYHLLIQNI